MINPAFKPLLDEIQNLLSSGELEELFNKLLFLTKVSDEYKNYTDIKDLDFEELSIREKVVCLEYQFNQSFYLGDYESAMKWLFLLTPQITKIKNSEFAFTLWEKIYKQNLEEVKKSFFVNLMKDFSFLNYALQTSLKYQLPIGGKKSCQALLRLICFAEEHKEVLSLINKVSLKLSDDSIQRRVKKYLPELSKIKYQDTEYQTIQGQEKLTSPNIQDITIIKGFLGD